ncbi:hypothetical protein [uncultured Roseobacter sp.]|uniref:hypothetical protein n=1 Tax=uncultured Roseobacter sp. TaxID=114847 RepID=UPI0026231D80|nr:hypothetical protein [uncultured Roseobacter sp.]
MRSYEAARGLFSFLSICAWGVIIIGVIVALIGGNAAASGIRGQTELQVLLGAAPGAIVAVAGFFGLALVQMGRASVDSAEYGQQVLEVSRQQLEVSREALAQGKTTAASYAAFARTSAASAMADEQSDQTQSHGSSYGDRETSPEAAEAASALSEEAMIDAQTAPAALQASTDPIQPALPEPVEETELNLRIDPEPETVLPSAEVSDQVTDERHATTVHAARVEVPILEPVSDAAAAPEKTPDDSVEELTPIGVVREVDGVFHFAGLTFRSKVEAQKYADRAAAVARAQSAHA